MANLGFVGLMGSQIVNRFLVAGYFANQLPYIKEASLYSDQISAKFRYA
jgi:hypothetical protein